MPALSYSHGACDVVLLGETIGANLARTVARVPDRDALVDVPSGRRWTYTELAAEVERGYWYIAEADAATVFRKDTGAMWQDLMKRLGKQPGRREGEIETRLPVPARSG